MPSLRGHALNAALRAFIRPRLRNNLSVDSLRAASATLERWIARGGAVLPREAATGDGGACEWSDDPAVDEHRVVLYLHGGGFITHLPLAYRRFAHVLGGALGARVLLPQYRLAPEHCFPAGANDCLDAYCWLLAQGVDPKRIVVGGDSAGGNLALVTAMRIRDEGLPAPGCVVMLSPTTDLNGGSASLTNNRGRDPMLVPEALPFVHTTYAPGTDSSHPWLSPLLGTFEQLPPLLFHVGSTELLLDDSIRAADKARQAGVTVEIEVWPEMPHVFQMVDWLPESRAAIAHIARFVRKHVPQADPVAGERAQRSLEHVN